MLTVCLILVSLGLITNFAIWGISAYAVIKEHRRVGSAWSQYFDQVAPDKPSVFAQTISQAADLCAERTRIMIDARERGAQGAAARDAARGLEEYAIENNPALAVAEMLPRSLKKNKTAEIGLTYLINNILSKQGSGVSGAPGSNGSVKGSQIKFNL